MAALVFVVGLMSVVAAVGAVGAPRVPSGSRSGVVNQPIAEPKSSVPPEIADVANRGHLVPAAKVLMRPVLKADNAKGPGRGDGCAPNYGEPGQCLPIVPPSVAGMGKMPGMTHSWTCAELVTLFSTGLKVTADSLKLNYNKDGLACGVSDV